MRIEGARVRRVRVRSNFHHCIACALTLKMSQTPDEIQLYVNRFVFHILTKYSSVINIEL